MDMSLIAPPVDQRLARELLPEPSASLVEYDLSIHREPPESTPAIGEGGATNRPAPSPHRRHAAAMIRQLGGRTEATLRRELDRFFAARPNLTHADRAAIVRAMSRYRNQILHHPRSTLRAAADADDPARARPLLDAVRRLFGLADAPHSSQAEPSMPA
jgi:hypothetical protein